MSIHPFYIAGDAVLSGDGTLEITNPANGEVVAEVPSASAAQVEKAIQSAHEAFPAWSAASPFERGAILRKASLIAKERSPQIARLMTQEQGKPYKEALGEAEKGADILRYYAEEGERVYGRIIAAPDGPDYRSEVIYQPLGVAAAISPWNYPIELLAWKAGGALAAGCTMVSKVPTETPLCALAFVECILDAGLPRGVLSALAGPGRKIGNLLTGHPLVSKVAFTGSTAVGRDVLRSASEGLKKVSLELGGSLPMLVFDDCNLDLAVAGAVRRSFRNMGQICIAVNRVYVQRGIYETFLEKFARGADALTIGDGLADECDLGPMCTARGLATVKEHVRDALSKGARLLAGGGAPEGERFQRGNFYKPTILADATREMLVMSEETFGPVVGVAPFDTLGEAIDMANDTPYGLAAIAYTTNLATARAVSVRVKAGNIAINNPDPGIINAPYGGWKESGFGCEHGPEGLMEYLAVKHVRVRYMAE